MEITKDTRVSAILEEYGDIADVMEVLASSAQGDIPCEYSRQKQ